MLIGREAQQSAIAGLLDGARLGQSGVLALVGEPGMGKSALLDRAVALAEGMSVLRARGVQSEARIPFAGLSELLRPALSHVERIPPYQAAALEGALALVPARAADRFAVGAATLSLLATYADDRPLLVVVDDAHWLDGSSAGALSFALRRLVADPVAVVLAVRAGEPSFLDQSDLPCMLLEGLGVDDASALITHTAGSVADELLHRVHRHTGGNPLAIIEAARDLEPYRDETPLDTPLPVVGRVSEAYVARARALPPSSRTMVLLAAASDLGDLPTLARAARQLAIDIADLGTAEDADLLAVRAGRVHFRHPLVRSAIYGDASPRERRRAHQALAGALPDADADRRAWHLALAALGPDDTASSALEQAALRSQGRNAYDVASLAFERAALLAPGEQHRSELLFRAADAARSAGQGPRALELLRQADEHADAGLRVAIEHLRGLTAVGLGPVSEGLAMLIDAAQRASGPDPERAVLMLADAINAGFHAGDARTMGAAADMIALLQPQVHTDRVSFFATMAQGMARTFVGPFEEGSKLLRRAVEMAESTPEAAEDPIWLMWAAMGPLWLRESHAGRQLVEHATEVARSRVAIGVLPHLLNYVAIDHASTHRWGEAEAVFHEVLQLCAETGQRIDQAGALAYLALVEARQGKEAACLAHAHEAIGLADELHLTLCKVWGLGALGDLHLARGQVDEALSVLEEKEALLQGAGIADVDLSAAPELVELHLRRGNVETATTLATVFGRHALAKGQPWALARAARCRGLLADDEQADDTFAEALAFHGRTPDRFETARSHLAYGSRLRRAGQRSRARQQLHTALELFDTLGAEPWSAAARNELAATGMTARRRNDTTRHLLTPQELQIALLLTSGHTTKQAAAALFLSPKTVEYHLRSVYRKLGCNTREELAMVLEGDPRNGRGGTAEVTEEGVNR